MDEKKPAVRRPKGRASIGAAVIALTLLMILVQLAGFIYSSSQQQRLDALGADVAEMRLVQQALVDEKESLEDYLLTDDPLYLQRYFTGQARLKQLRGSALQRLGPVTLTAFDRLSTLWDRVTSLEQSGAPQQARALAAGPQARLLLDRIRDSIGGYIAAKERQAEREQRNIALSRQLVLALQVLSGLLALLGLYVALRSSMAREQVECLFQMADVLQSASGYEDAKAVLRASALRLLPDLGGGLYVFNNSRDRLELLTSWNETADFRPSRTIAPSTCWAIKRGKVHTNSAEDTSIACGHYAGRSTLLEMPMAARGEIYGLLKFSAEGERAAGRLRAAQPVIAALADAMSLALSNIALREKLRNQALRDPLTGLYNRRYMEDMLQRFVQLSRRDGNPVAVMMIDLDHFKALNDEHGHLVGDTVLRSVASTITGALREEDIACRYGGEELTVLLPGCGLADALNKAEVLRSRIESLTETHGARISASLGVAATPDCSTNADELLTLADAALYQAKEAGRNQVASAPKRLEGIAQLLAAAE